MSQMDKEQKYTNDYFYPRTECNQYSVEKCHRWTKNRNTPMTIFIRGRSVIIILWKMTQMDRKQTQINYYFNTLPYNWLDISGERLKIYLNKNNRLHGLICLRIWTNDLPFSKRLWFFLQCSFQHLHSSSIQKYTIIQQASYMFRHYSVTIREVFDKEKNTALANCDMEDECAIY